MLGVMATSFKGRNHVENILFGKIEVFMNKECMFSRLLENYLERIDGNNLSQCETRMLMEVT